MDRRAALIAVGGLALVVIAYRPIASASWMFWEGATDAWMSGTPTHAAVRVLPRWTTAHAPSPAATQVVNLGLHIAVAGVTTLFVRTLGVTWMWAVCAGTLLLVNPVAVETIRHGTGRADVLVGLGTVGACLAAVHRRWLWMGVGLLVALLSKESGIVSLLLVPLVVWRGQYPVSRAQIVWYGVGLGLVGLAGVAYWIPDASLATLVDRDLYAESVTARSWGLVQMTATVRLLTTALAGVGMTPDFDYDAVTIPWRVASAVSLVGLCGLIWWWHTTYPIATLGCAWIVVASAPRWVFKTPRGYYTEHQFYVALVGIVMMVIGILSPSTRETGT